MTKVIYSDDQETRCLEQNMLLAFAGKNMRRTIFDKLSLQLLTVKRLHIRQQLSMAAHMELLHTM